ncbi:MAG: GMP synthase (glutamine-hydrolyzing), partial [bacterium]|nr:GMP synthase (glutamine-hydrolyzing) [bacterium]
AINEFDLKERMIWQCPTVLLPLSVNGEPTGAVVSPKNNESFVLRPISSTDAMTANFALIPKEQLEGILTKLQNLAPSAIFYDITNKPPGTIEWE